MLKTYGDLTINLEEILLVRWGFCQNAAEGVWGSKVEFKNGETIIIRHDDPGFERFESEVKALCRGDV